MALAEIPLAFRLTLALILGLLVGSFFNVLIYRMPRDESVLWPPSHCPACGRRVRFYDNIPVLAWLWLRGRCRDCRAPIGPVYPAVELFTGLLSLGLAWFFSRPGAPYTPAFAIGMAYLILTAIPVFAIDCKHFLIPDLVTLPGIALGLGLSFLPGAPTPLQALIAAAGAGGLLWAVALVAEKLLKKEAMGFGDVKLLAMGGALLGLQDALLGLMFASVLGCLVGFPLLLLRKLDGDRRIPFGPYLCVGLILAGLWGERLLDGYFRLLGLPAG